DFLEGRYREEPVVHGVALADGGQPLNRTQRLELGEREVVGEPAGDRHAVQYDGAPAPGELGAAGHVGRAADLRLVPGDQHVVHGRTQVRLDEVGAHAGGQLIRGERVFGPVAGRAAMADDKRPRAVPALTGGAGR